MVVPEQVIANLAASLDAVVLAVQTETAIERTSSENVPVSGKEIRKELNEAASALRMKATSVGLLWADPSNKPKLQEASSLLSEYEQTVARICNLCLRVLSGAGKSLRASILGFAKALVEASTRLLGVLEDGSMHGQLTTLTGVVWEACDAAKTLPTDNKAAINRRLTQAAKSVKDAVREANEMKDSWKPSGVGEDDEGDEPDFQAGSDDEDLDFEAEALSAEETAVAEAAVQLASRLLDALKALLKVWLSAELPDGDVAGVGRREEVLQQSLGSSAAAENLVAALYAPQDPDEVERAAADILTHWKAARERAEGEECAKAAEGLESLLGATDVLKASVATLRGSKAD
uniref:Cyclin-D1-binding protein 1-like N-terminal domain-containing protein n=1 Tax=Tetraselmis sp. GSL018 TaxID=582737 RepID=A0A061R102_9CHLO|mmetsp:Transcript_30225/g.71928  ORF Transcript_30225/g.71928 Transcript_30225/m.71928 type:complete len:348 (+) Transcript_30225:104-1147(+)|eukprot:CAMPEP_0177599886 /NCGR_PEP_ID=MMETSP0419_2-20121207/13275_1 /TAXON_ID=582737 /ORGANISM="Tetraselmis sp., Strain GSL018" /LENGTH=347 /DNA_ID=CAMNT_0019092735 /DNA_START=36 /DNA_END=1079 /DNA_ORIENTATION=+